MPPLRAQIALAERPKGRDPLWRCRVSSAERVLFDDTWVSLRFTEHAGAEWLARLVERAHDAGVYVPPPGHGRASEVVWTGVLHDDCSAEIGPFVLHAEHLQGPSRGGFWYFSVGEGTQPLWHFADVAGLELRSGDAARWLAELVAHAARVGVLAPPAER